MADYNSQLPVRSKDDLDERVLIKVQDGDDPSGVGKTQEVSEKKAHVRNFSKDSDGNDQEQLLSQEGHTQSNGDYDATTNKRPSSQGLIVSDRDASPSESTMNKRPTAVVGEGDSICLDISLHDQDGNYYDANNPLYVVSTDDPADEIISFDQAVAIVKDASANHDYTTTSEFRSLNVEASASGKARFELQAETAAASGVFETVGVKFNSTSNPNVEFKLTKPKSVPSGAIIRVVKTNLDNQAQDLYSTINGIEI
jgi:hypothetical protein